MLRLVYSNRGLPRRATSSAPFAPTSTHSWSVSQIAKNLSELNGLKPTHVGYINQVVNNLLENARREHRAPREALPLLRRADSSGGDCL